jgi:hypothetical protein
LDGIRWSAEPGSEVMRQLHLPPTFRSKKRDARVRLGKNSARSGNLQILIQAIHNRQHINLRKKKCPDRGTFVENLLISEHLNLKGGNLAGITKSGPSRMDQRGALLGE